MVMAGEFEATKTDREYFGVFREEESLAGGDPYHQHAYKHSRFGGKQFGTLGVQGKGGNTVGPDGLIDKTMKLTVGGDTYLDAREVEKKLTKQLGGENVSTKAFVPVNPAAKSTGAGSLFGTFGPQESLVDLDASASAHRPKQTTMADRKRNLYVNPPKKGSYGYPVSDRTIGQTKLAYIPDTYAYGRTLERQMKKDARAKINKPFVGMGRTGRGIEPAPFLSSPGPDTRPGKASTANTGPRWKPANPATKGKGDYGCINKLEYVPNPEKPTQRRDPSEKSKMFKPVGNGHTRLSMWAPNPYACDARPPPDNDFTLLD